MQKLTFSKMRFPLTCLTILVLTHYTARTLLPDFPYDCVCKKLKNLPQSYYDSLMIAKDSMRRKQLEDTTYFLKYLKGTTDSSMQNKDSTVYIENRNEIIYPK